MYAQMQDPLSDVTMDSLGTHVISTRSIMQLCEIMQFDPSSQTHRRSTKDHLVTFINITEAERGSPGDKTDGRVPSP